MRSVTCNALLVIAFSTILPFAGHGADRPPSLTLTPVVTKTSPGLACVVVLAIENHGPDPIEVVDAEQLAFLVVEWTWRWEWDQDGSKRSYTLTHKDLAYAIPQLRPIEPVVVPPLKKREWVIVIPVPSALDGQHAARLVATYAPQNGGRISGQAEFTIHEPVRVDGPPPLDAKFVQVAISTGTEWQVQGFFKTMGVTEEIKRRGVAGETPLLLAWFCSRLYRNQFEEEAWTTLTGHSAQYRAIRDANLHRALKGGKVRLTQDQADSIKEQVAGAYPFSDAMIEAARKCVQ